MSAGSRQSARIAIAGNTCIDVLVRDVQDVDRSARDSWGTNVEFLERPVEPVIGGGGVGPALILGHLGHAVALNTNIGQDRWGQLAAQRVREARVEIVEPSGGASPTNVILLRPDGRRTSYFHTGRKVDWKKSLDGGDAVGCDAAWFFASGFGQVDQSDLVELRHVFGHFRKLGVETAFDPSPWFAHNGADASLMLEVFGVLSCLVATEEELLAWHQAPSAEQLARELLETGPTIVVVKCGAEGAAWASRSAGSGTVPTEAVTGTNTTGAGDAFNGQLLDGLIHGVDCPAAVAAAVATATAVASRGQGVEAWSESS